MLRIVSIDGNPIIAFKDAPEAVHEAVHEGIVDPYSQIAAELNVPRRVVKSDLLGMAYGGITTGRTQESPPDRNPRGRAGENEARVEMERRVDVVEQVAYQVIAATARQTPPDQLASVVLQIVDRTESRVAQLRRDFALLYPTTVEDKS